MTLKELEMRNENIDLDKYIDGTPRMVRRFY